MEDDFFLTNLELRETTPTGEVTEGLSHRSMAGLFLLHVLELAARGEPRGAVTIVHDAGDHGGRYKRLAAALAEAGWAVALPDMRGHGGSEGDRGHCGGVQEVVRDLQEVQDHLAYRMPDAPKVLLGQGLGALWTAAFALERPGMVQALVLVAPLFEPRFDLPAAPTGVKRLFKKIGPKSPGRIGWSADQLSGSAEEQEAWREDDRVHDVVTLRAATEAQQAAREYLPRIGHAGVPVLVLHGEADPISPPSRTRGLASDVVEVRILPGRRHQPLRDLGAEELERDLARWLDEKLPR